MSQSRRASFVESMVQVTLGFAIALAVQVWIVFPLFDIKVSLSANAGIALIMLSISLVRSYVIRRAAEWIQGWIEWPKF